MKVEESPVTGTSFTVSYTDEEHCYYAYITTDLLTIDEEGTIKCTDTIKNSTERFGLIIPYSINGITVESIGVEASKDCTYLTSITISGSVKTIDVSAFEKCTKISSLIIPNGVTTIGNRALFSCISLINVSISNSVTVIGQRAFSQCSYLEICIDKPNDGTLTGAPWGATNATVKWKGEF